MSEHTPGYGEAFDKAAHELWLHYEKQDGENPTKEQIDFVVGMVLMNAYPVLKEVFRRERVDEYKELRLRVERLVGEINGEYGEIGQMPVQYLHRSVDQVELAALYAAADVMLVTPLRDGMNLVSKEYVASRIDNTGSLVLSEFTGAARELTSALQVNPHDIDGVVEAMERALHMPAQEQAKRMRAMRRVVKRHDVYTWAREFFDTLEHAPVTQGA